MALNDQWNARTTRHRRMLIVERLEIDRKKAIGLSGAVCPPGKIPESVSASDFAVYASVFPEQKFYLVKAFQRSGHAVGMCGDGANDAPTLRQAQMGIAVSTATDVSKAAAGMVLTEACLGGIVTAIKEGRAAFQRILTYTLTILINKCATLVALGVGLAMTRHAVLTPLLLALSMLTNDFVTMSRTADRARPSLYPNAWHIRNLVLAAVPLSLFKLLYCVMVLVPRSVDGSGGESWPAIQQGNPSFPYFIFCW
jgi:H+-transporting ATPase